MLINGLHRILDLAVSGRRVGGLKPSVDLAALPMRPPWPAAMPRDYNQLALNSCGPNTIGERYEFEFGSKFSRLFLYFWTRGLEHDTAQDAGVTIPDLLDVAHTFGMPPEELWPYDPERFADAPPSSCLPPAQARRVLLHDQVVDLDHLLHELGTAAAAKKPASVVIGFGVPASMEDGQGDTATTGLVPVPSASNPLVGRHAVNAVTYDRATRRVQTTHHWGKEYGDNGTLWLPFEHFDAGNITDMRIIRKIGAA